MLNATIHRKLQFIAAILLAFVIAAATVYPLRIYTEDHVYSSGLGISAVSGEVTENYDAGDYFIAQYDHLQTLEFYVVSVTSGTQAIFQLFHYVDQWTMELVAEEKVELPDEVPGYAVVSVDADLEVGETYVYTVRGTDGSRFTVGFESLNGALDTGKAPYYTLGFYNDTTQEGLALQMRVTYRVALSKWPSLAMIAGFLLLAVLAILLVGHYYKAHPERNVERTVLQALQHVFTPAVLVAGAIAFIAVWPMKLFDSRLPDILIYETGIVLAVLLVLYALWHDRKGIPGTLSIHHLRRNVWHYFIILCIALILDCSADYMNATSDLQHYVSMHLIVALLCAIIYMMGDAKANLNAWVSRVFAVGTVIGVVYYLVNRVPASETDAAMLNAVLSSRALACVMAAIAATATAVTLVQRRRAGRRPETSVSRVLVVLVVILSVMLILFRNTRLWIPLLVGIWTMFYLRYRYWSGRVRLLQDLCEGIILDFLFKVGYSMLRRYYMAYRFSRFSMQFHTVTVTSYYLAIVAAAALTLYVWKYRETSGLRLRERMAHMWKESFLLGLVGAYMMMTLTRSGIGAFAIFVAVAALACSAELPRTAPAAVRNSAAGSSVRASAPSGDTSASPAGAVTDPGAGPDGMEPGGAAGAKDRNAEEPGAVRTGEADVSERKHGGRARRFLSALAAMVLTVLLAFPITFTGQRLISTVYGQPDTFDAEILGDYDDWLVRNVTWNCTRFMNIEVYIRDFGDRVLGGELGSKLYYGMGWNVPQGYRTSQLEENSPYEEVEMLASAADSSYAAGLLLTDTADAGDYTEGDLEAGDASNGRIALYLAYLQNMNLTGHDVMGVEMENGETALHAHNIVLQVSYDCGIPTGILFLVVLAALFLGALRDAKKAAKSTLVEKDEAGGDYRRSRYALMPLLLMTGFCVIGVVEWLFHFSNPFTIVVLFAIAPVLFPEKEMV